MKRLLCSFLLIATLLPIGAFGAELRVGILNGPTGIPAAYLFENPPSFGNTVVSFQTFASPAAELPKLIKGDIDIGFLPVNVAAKAYSASKGAVIAVSVVGDGMLFLITKDDGVHSFFDLKGKKIAVAGQGATPDYMTRYLLTKSGLDAEKDVTLDFSFENSYIVPALLAGKADCAVVPEPFATVAEIKDPLCKRAIDVQKEYIKTSSANENYPMTLMVVRKSFASGHISDVAAFCRKYKEALLWTASNPAKAGELVQKHTLGLQAAVVEKAVPSCNFVYEDAASAKKRIESLLRIFLRFAPETVGGKLPDSGFYFEQ